MKKSRWWLAPAGFVAAVAIGFGGAQLRDVLVEDSTPPEAITPSTQVAPTTTEPAPITTVAPATTSTSLAEVNLDDVITELGLLMEGRDGRLGDFTYQALISGVVLSVENEQVTFQEEGAASVGDGWVVYVHLGDHPEPGETIVGRLLLLVPDSATIDVVAYCSSFAGGSNCGTAREEEEVVSLLEVGNVYHFFLAMETFCEDLPEEFQPEDQERCRQFENNQASFHAYHSELVAALKGGELPDPGGLGRVGVVEFLRGGGIRP